MYIILFLDCNKNIIGAYVSAHRAADAIQNSILEGEEEPSHLVVDRCVKNLRAVNKAVKDFLEKGETIRGVFECIDMETYDTDPHEFIVMRVDQ